MGLEEPAHLHELSIAEAVVRIVGEQTGGRQVTKVQMKVEYLRQVVPSALAFSFELVARRTPADAGTSNESALSLSTRRVR